MSEIELKALELAKKEIVKRSKKTLTIKELSNILEKNNFRGLQIHNKKEFTKLKEEQDITSNASGFFNHDTKIIHIDREEYQKNPNLVVHELIHAIIGRKIIKTIDYPELYNDFGTCIEEGLASFMENSTDINAITPFEGHSYPLERKLILQLQDFYNYYSKKKYNSFVEFALKEPENVLPTIRLMYLEILNKINPSEDNNELSYSIALNTISSYDDVTRERSYNLGDIITKNMSLRLRNNVENIHNIMISMLDQDILKGKGYQRHQSFDLLPYQKTNELFKMINEQERLLIAILDKKSISKIISSIQMRKIKYLTCNSIFDREELTEEKAHSYKKWI